MCLLTPRKRCVHFSLSQGKLGEAEPLFKESLAIDKKVYGDEHPDIATDLNNLAELLRTQVRTFLQIPRCLFFVLWSAFSCYLATSCY